MNKLHCHYRGKFLSMLERDNWEFAERINSQGVVVIVATTDEQDIVLVEQFRTPVNACVIELPAAYGSPPQHTGNLLFNNRISKLWKTQIHRTVWE